MGLRERLDDSAYQSTTMTNEPFTFKANPFQPLFTMKGTPLTRTTHDPAFIESTLPQPLVWGLPRAAQAHIQGNHPKETLLLDEDRDSTLRYFNSYRRQTVASGADDCQLRLDCT